MVCSKTTKTLSWWETRLMIKNLSIKVCSILSIRSLPTIISSVKPSKWLLTQQLKTLIVPTLQMEWVKLIQSVTMKTIPMLVEPITLETIILLLVTNKEDNQTVEEVWPPLKSKFILINIQIFNILSEEVVPQPPDRLIHISLTSDMLRREIHPHGQDTMLNHNSVSMVIASARKILVNVTVLPGTVELRMKLELELPPGINSECGHPFLRPKITNILDATNTHSEK